MMNSTEINTSAETTNGVNITQLKETIAAIQDQPSLAQCQFRSEGKWVDGGHNQSIISGYYCAGQEHERSEPFVMDKDEPPVLLGNDIGANPVEYVLSALAGCITTSTVYHGAAQGIELDAINTSLEGDLDMRGFLGLSTEVRKGYESLRIKFTVKSEASAEKLRELLAMSPVLDIITNPTPVSIEIEKV